MPDPDNRARRLILFDGVCNLCHGFVRFVVKRDPDRLFKLASLQSPYARDLLSRLGYQNNVLNSVIFVEDNTIYQSSAAVFRIFKHLSGLWPVLAFLRYLPQPLSDWGYRLIANNRYRLFGKKESCPLPRVEDKERFVEG